jgi:hypothetical protein
MPLLSNSKTTKLFYKKWPYKITVGMTCAYILRRFNIEMLTRLVAGNSINAVYHVRLLKFATMVQPYSNLDINFRYSEKSVYIYVKDSDLYRELVDLLVDDFMINTVEPSNSDDLDALEGDHDVILCDKLPLNKYGYKISFKEILPEDRIKFSEWLSNYENTVIRVPKGFYRYLNQSYNTWGTHYIYAIDEHTTTLVTLASSGYVKRVQHYIVRETVNYREAEA